MADGGMSAQAFAADGLGGPGGIFGLHHLEAGMSRKEVAALHQGDRMGVDLRKRIPVVVGQAHDAVFDVQLVLSDDGHSAFTQQLIVVKQASGYGVLDGHQPEAGIVGTHGFNHALEGGTAHRFHLFFAKVLMGGDVVKRAFDALNCYLHNGILFP